MRAARDAPLKSCLLGSCLLLSTAASAEHVSRVARRWRRRNADRRKRIVGFDVVVTRAATDFFLPVALAFGVADGAVPERRSWSALLGCLTTHGKQLRRLLRGV